MILLTVEMQALPSINLAAQILLALALLTAVNLAKKKAFSRHCTVMRIAAALQILAIMAIMLPPMSDYLRYTSQSPLIQMEIAVHHALGLIVVVLWIYINLVFMKYIPAYLNARTAMRLGFAFWMLSLLLGIHIFMILYL